MMQPLEMGQPGKSSTFWLLKLRRQKEHCQGGPWQVIVRKQAECLSAVWLTTASFQPLTAALPCLSPSVAATFIQNPSPKRLVSVLPFSHVWSLPAPPYSNPRTPSSVASYKARSVLTVAISVWESPVDYERLESRTLLCSPLVHYGNFIPITSSIAIAQNRCWRKECLEWIRNPIILARTNLKSRKEFEKNSKMATSSSFYKISKVSKEEEIQQCV